MVKKTKVIRIGVDLDGVITKNFLKAARIGVSVVKHKILGIKRLSFFVPKNGWQKLMYIGGIILPSYVPARGAEKMKAMARKGKYEFYLVTGRYGFVKEMTVSWLQKRELLPVFKKIYINELDEQPHVFKQRLVNKYHFDYFIEDNWDIVQYLAGGEKTRICWVVNILDQNKSFPHKFSNLQAVLEKIEEENENTD